MEIVIFVTRENSYLMPTDNRIYQASLVQLKYIPSIQKNMNNICKPLPDSLQIKLKRIRKKIDTSSGCGYLYHHFDDLISDLEKWHIANPEALDHKELFDTVKKFIDESTFRTWGSPGWLLYSARCFYCANVMLKYIHGNEVRKILQEYQTECFRRLLSTEVVSVLDRFLLNEFLGKFRNTPYLKEVYQCAIDKSIETSRKHRPIDSRCEYIAYKGSVRAKELIETYISDTGDNTLLKKWIPQLDTPRLAYIWYEFPERFIHSPRFHRHLIDSVQDYLDKSLENHLELWGIWFDSNIYEVVECNSAETLIEVLEVMDDEEFDDILNRIVLLPYNDKVFKILNHFSEDDELWIVNLSKRLLSQYMLSKR